jgi:hypothetical protein
MQKILRADSVTCSREKETTILVANNNYNFHLLAVLTLVVAQGTVILLRFVE